MTFEEFFKKKKINLPAFQLAEADLFAEFKTHYEAMGEKSFDHTKKYWFNKLRRQFVLPPEVKTEKVIIENQLAEQTITETLTEPTADKPKTGFTPRFKAPGATPKPAESTPTATDERKDEAPVTTETAPVTTKPGFTPRFKAGVTAPKTEEPTTDATPTAEQTEQPAVPKVGFTPRFKAGVTSPAKATEPAEDKKPETTAPDAEKPAAEVGFTPRFKAGVTPLKPKQEEPIKAEIPKEEKPAEELPKQETEQSDTPAKPAAKIGFKPRFKPPQQ